MGMKGLILRCSGNIRNGFEQFLDIWGTFEDFWAIFVDALGKS